MSTFRVSRPRLWWGVALLVAPVMVLLRAGFMVAGAPAWDSTDLLQAGLVAAAAGTGAVIGVGRPGWVRVSAEGLEFAAPRHRGTFLPWAAVESARLRFTGPFTQLVVTPTRADAAFVAETSGRVARLRRGAFVVEVGSMTPGPAALLAEVNRRLAPAG